MARSLTQIVKNVTNKGLCVFVIVDVMSRRSGARFVKYL